MKCSHCSYENPTESIFCNKCGAKLASPAKMLDPTRPYFVPKFELEIGSTFAGRYKIIEEIGKGGMGRVYKALDDEIKEKIAIKVLKPEITANEKTIERFRNELKLARKITHQNVCRMYDLAKDQGLYYITMEYISGEDLKSTICRIGQLSVGKTLAVAKQICKGLAEAHRLGVVHRDLKPQNIIIDRDGEVRIMDFGIARMMKSEGVTESGFIVGTPEYMSPEQAAGDEVDARSDIYSLGIILFELLTGTVPFRSENAVGVALKQKTEPTPSPKSLNPQIPEEVNQLILRCLEKDKNHRFQSVEKILEEISHLEKGLPTTERLVPEGRSTAPMIKTKPRFRPLLPSLIFIGFALAIGGYFLLRPKPPQPIPPPAPPTPENGVLVISSIPEEARVYVNDEFKGLTPLNKLELPAGTYRITISHPDYQEITEDVQLNAGETLPKEYALEKAYILEINSEPPGATIEIDGELHGKTPQSLKWSKNVCQLKIDKGKGWIPYNEALTLNPGKNSIGVTLKRLLVKISIKTNPSGALVSLGDKPLGLSPVEGRQIQAGSYNLSVKKEGYKKESKKIDVYSDYDESIPLVWIGQGSITLSADPDADISLSGIFFTRVPPRKTLPIDAGKHTLDFFSPKLNKKCPVIVEVQHGKTVRIHVKMETCEAIVEEIK